MAACKHRAGRSAGRCRAARSPAIVGSAVGERRQAQRRSLPAPRRQARAVALQPSAAARTDRRMAAAEPSPAAAGGWSGRFGEPVSERVKRYTASVDFDRRLADADIAGSLAHARMLAAVGRPRAATTSPRSSAGMADDPRRDRARRIRVVARPRGRPPQHREAADRARRRRRQAPAHRRARATTRSPPTSGSGCAARSTRSSRSSPRCAARFIDLAERHADTIMPGFTHLQVAQPVTFGHHLLAYDAMLARDAERFADCRRRVNRLPLGSAALAGTTLPDRPRSGRARARLRRRCATTRSTPCPIAISRSNSPPPPRSSMMHLSRFAEELVLWIEPALRLRRARRPLLHRLARSCRRRRIPDVPELVRGKTGRVDRPPGRAADADEGPAARVQQGQPGRQGAAVRHGRHARRHARDHDATSSRPASTSTRARMRAAAREGFATATDLADYLVRKGVPFRDAHEAVARAVRHAESAGVRPRRAAARRAAGVRARDRRRRLRRADARRLRREPRPSGRHRAARRCAPRSRHARGSRADARARAPDARAPHLQPRRSEPDEARPTSRFSVSASWAIRWPGISRAPGIASPSTTARRTRRAQWVGEHGGSERPTPAAAAARTPTS